MPAWGIVPDSPLIYWGGKAFRGAKPNRRRRSSGSRGPVDFSFRFDKLTIYKPVLHFELTHRNGMTGRYLHRVARGIQVDAKQQVGVRSGRLRRSIRIIHEDGAGGHSVKIGSNLHYAYLHHEGTKPHLIMPKPPNKLLSFRSGTSLIRTTLVRHPGTKPNRYLSDQLARHIR